MRRNLTVGFLAAVWLAAVALAAGEPRYQATNLGSLGGEGYATAINVSGVVVGNYTTNQGDRRAFIWESQQLTDLGTLGGNTFANGINDQGQVCGTSKSAVDNANHAFLWTRAGGMQDLGVPAPGKQSGAVGINNQGQVCGLATFEGVNGFQAFVWQSGVFTRLDPLPGDSGGGSAASINDAGQVCGESSSSATDFRQRACFWPGVGQAPVDMGLLAGTNQSSALSINSRGQCCGYAADSEGRLLPFLWSQATGMQALAMPAGARYAIAQDLSEPAAGLVGTRDEAPPTVVGQVGLENNARAAEAWINGTPVNLNLTLFNSGPWILESALGINPGGLIIGGGAFDVVGSRPFLLTPAAAPPEADLKVVFPHAGLVPRTKGVYQITVTNQGPQQTTNVRLTHRIPSGLKFVSARGSGGLTVTRVGSTLRGALAALVPGAKATLTVRVLTSGKKTYHARATVSATEKDPDPANNSASATLTVTGKADLEASLQAPAHAKPNQTLLVIATLKNLGPDPTAPVFQLETVGTPATIGEVTASQGTFERELGTRVVFDPGVLRPGSSLRVTVRLTPTRVGLVGIAVKSYPELDDEDPREANDGAFQTVKIRK